MKRSKSNMHAYDVGDAVEHSIPEAVVMHNFRFWLRENKAHNRNIKDGRVWTFTTAEALSEVLPELSVHQIRHILKKLSEKGILIKGNYNKVGYDRTLWYSLDEEEFATETADGDDTTPKSNSENTKNDLADLRNGIRRNTTPIPDTNTDSKPNVNTLSNTREEEGEIQDILDTWNQLYGCNLRMTKKRIGHIRQRIKEYSPDDIKTAMEKRLTNRYWNTPAGRPHRNNFDSFIRNDEQVDKYLNQEATHTYTSKEELPF